MKGIWFFKILLWLIWAKIYKAHMFSESGNERSMLSLEMKVETGKEVAEGWR